MTEVKLENPLSYHLKLIKTEGTLHRRFFLAFVEKIETKLKSNGGSKLYCCFNRSILAEEIEKETLDQLTPKTISFILATAFRASGLREGRHKDWWKSTAAGGCRVLYHLIVTQAALSKLKKFLKIKSVVQTNHIFL